MTPIVLPAGTTCHCERNGWQRREGDGGILVICGSCGYVAAITGDGSELSPGVSLHKVTLTLCSLCILGEGGECHTPGCSMWMNRAPDIPLTLVTDDVQ
jgi:hypothetical protein